MLLNSCVTHKQYLISELQSNFLTNKDKFYESKGLNDKPEYNIIIYYDNKLSKDYEVLSYNTISSFKPFLIFYRNHWMVNKRIFQILHYGYCTGLIEHSDGILIEPDLSAVKFVRFEGSRKTEYVKPQKTKFSPGISVGAGFEFMEPLYTFARAGFSLDKSLNCFLSLSHNFELGFGYRKKTGSPSYMNKYSKTYMRYRLLFKYSISEWLVNTYNINAKKDGAFTFNIGPNFDLFYNSISRELSNDIITYKYVRKHPFSLGLSLGFDLKVNDKVTFEIGADSKLLNLISGTKYVNYNGLGDPSNKNTNRDFNPEVAVDLDRLMLNFGIKVNL